MTPSKVACLCRPAILGLALLAGGLAATKPAMASDSAPEWSSHGASDFGPRLGRGETRHRGDEAIVLAQRGTGMGPPWPRRFDRPGGRQRERGWTDNPLLFESSEAIRFENRVDEINEYAQNQFQRIRTSIEKCDKQEYNRLKEWFLKSATFDINNELKLVNGYIEFWDDIILRTRKYIKATEQIIIVEKNCQNQTIKQ